MRMFLTLWMVAVCTRLSPALTVRDTLPRYTITDLGMLNGYKSSFAKALNDKGQVVGYCNQVDEESDCAGFAFVYRNGTMTALDTLQNSKVNVAYGINNRGDIVGSNGHHAFLIHDNHAEDLGTLGGSTSSANAINDKGDIVGNATQNDTDMPVAFLYRHHKMMRLPGLDDRYSVAMRINNAGQVVGYHDSSCTCGMIYNGETIAYLCTEKDYSASYAMGLNDKGDVVGTYESVGYKYAFLYHDGQTTTLETVYDPRPHARHYSFATAINNRGQIVGYYSLDDPGWSGFHQDMFHAYLYQSGRAIDLDTLIPPDSGWRLYEATAINNRGQIVGYGAHNGATRAFLLTPSSTDQGDKRP